MKIATVTWRFPEETEPQVNGQLSRMLERGIECEVIADELRSRVPLPAALRERVVARQAEPGGRRWSRPEPAILTSDADVFYFQHVGVALKYRRLLGRLDGPKVASARGSDVRIESIESRLVAERLREVLPQLDRIHCVSHELAVRCRSFGARPEQLYVAPTGVDLDVFKRRPAPSRPPGAPLRILSVGRLHWAKGFEYAVQAIHELRARGHAVSYTIVGPDQGAAESLRLAISDFDLREVVELAGLLPPEGIRDALAGADLLLLSSLSEGAPVAAMEAMAMGVPVVATDVGGTAEIVVDGEHGYLVPARDARALADAIERLMPEEARQRMGEAAAQHAARDLDRVAQVDGLIDVLEDAATRHRPRRPVAAGTAAGLVSVVITAKDAAATIDDQLRALAFQQYAGGWEVIVVDNGSTDDTRRRVLGWRDRLPGLRVIDVDAPGPVGRGRNAGVRAASADHIVMCDADDVVAPGWLAAMAGALQEDTLVCGALERALLAPGGAGRGLDTGPVLDIHGRVRLLTGNCGFQRQVFDQVGGFDEKLRRGEDIDFGWRAYRAGYEAHFVSDAIVHYRPRRRLTDVARQAFADGRCWPALYVRHRALGMDRPPPRDAVQRYRDLVRGPRSDTWADAGPTGWIYGVAWSAGRAAGSARHRVVVL
jgi:glycosyltransferase involved in cell wall biosynthesis